MSEISHTYFFFAGLYAFRDSPPEYERSNYMIYSHEVETMCPIAQGVAHGAAPIPEEAKWVKAKEIKDNGYYQSLQYEKRRNRRYGSIGRFVSDGL